MEDQIRSIDLDSRGGSGYKERCINVRYILEKELKGAADGLSMGSKEKKGTAQVSSFIFGDSLY